MLPKKSLTRASENSKRQEIETIMNEEAPLFAVHLRNKKKGTGIAKVQSYTVKFIVAVLSVSTPLKLYVSPLIVIVPEYVP